MKQILILLIVFINTMVFSQSSGDIPYMGFPDLLPNSPEASSLGKYTDIPVGLFTGTPNIDIPLYEININDFKLPIHLNYNSNGIKVDQISSNVGLGWTLFAGGVITRNLNDNADELYRDVLPDYEYNSQEMQDFLKGINNNSDQHDTKPDIFSYNFNGHFGKFYLDENFEPSLIEPSDIIIEKLSGFGVENTTDYSFKATTSEGIVFWFGGVNAVESSHLNTSSGGGHSNPTDVVQNAWYLSKITFPDNNESITFEYVISNAYHISSVSQNVKAKKIIDEGINAGLPTYIAAVHTMPFVTYVYPNMARISGINWGSGQIDFIYSSRYNVGNFFKLETINIFNMDQNLIKSYYFDYLQIDCASTFNNPDLQSLNDQTINKRLFLTSIQDVTSGFNAPNPYLFEYYTPNELPPRLSYAQDYWGFFNGKDNPDLVPDDLSFFQENWYNSINVDYNEISPFFQNVGGDRNADSEYGIKGLLKKIIYPTGGFDLLEYEGNTIYTFEHQPPPAIPIEIDVETDEASFNNVETYTTDIIPYTQELVPLYVNVTTATCWDSGNPDFISMTLSVEDITNNSDVNLYMYNDITGQYFSISTPLTIYKNSENDYFITYEQDHIYEFQIELIRPCLYGNLVTSYHNEYGEDVYLNKEVGGMRVKKIKSNDSYGTEKVRSFYYGDWDNLINSTGILEPVKPAISYYDEESEYYSNEHYYEKAVITINLSSSSLFSISNFQGNHINYESVIEGLGNNFENGAIVHKFNIEDDAYPNIYYDPVLGTPNTNLSFENGKEIETITYRNDNGTFSKTNKTLNYYTNDNSLQNTFQGFSTSIASQDVTNYDMKSNLCTYNINTQWHYLYKSDNYIYDENGINPILTTTNYFYDNENHLQLTKKQTTDSKGNILKDYYYYPGDFDNIENFSTLIGKNIISKPVKTISTNSGNIADGNIYKYDDNGSIIEVEKYENANLIAKPTHDPSIVTTIPNHFNLKSGFSYDPITKKMTEYLPVDDYPVSYIWGYNYTQIIATVENGLYDNVKITLSTLGYPVEDLQTKTETDLIAIFNELRNNLPNTLITSYTYKPLVGMKTETDPAGKTIFYDYDDFNRLETIKDQDGNIIKHIDYNYKTQ